MPLKTGQEWQKDSCDLGAVFLEAMALAEFPTCEEKHCFWKPQPRGASARLAELPPGEEPRDLETVLWEAAPLSGLLPGQNRRDVEAFFLEATPPAELPPG